MSHYGIVEMRREDRHVPDILALPPADALAQVENWYEN